MVPQGMPPQVYQYQGKSIDMFVKLKDNEYNIISNTNGDALST